MNLLLWGLILILQNAAFTLVSRARNSRSIMYHAWASVLSNGLWFVSQFMLIDVATTMIASGGGIIEALPLGGYYIICTMVGSLAMHYIALHKIERGGG